MRRFLRRRQSGAVLMETVLWVPILVVLLMGTVELTRVTYTYYTLKKILYNLTRYAGTQSGVNFCDENDAILVAAKSMALTGTPDGSGDPLLPGLTADQIRIRLERFSTDSGALLECACEASAYGCDAAQGAPSPDYIVATIPEGYGVTLRIPGISNEPIPLKPQVRLPFGGL
jgi:hypothetical protein